MTTATSSGRIAQLRAAKSPRRARAFRSCRFEPGNAVLDREGRAAAAAAGGVRVLEGETGFLEVAAIIDRGAVQVLGAEVVHEQPDAARLDHVIVVGRLVLDVQGVLEARAAARHYADPQARHRGVHLLL